MGAVELTPVLDATPGRPPLPGCGDVSLTPLGVYLVWYWNSYFTLRTSSLDRMKRTESFIQRVRSYWCLLLSNTHTLAVEFRTALPTFSRLLYDKSVHTPIFLLAQAIAFKVLLSVVPFLVLLTGLLGQWLAREEVFSVVERFVEHLLPAYVSEQVLSYTREVALAGGVFTIAGAIGLFVSALTLMTTLRQALTLLFQGEHRIERSIARGYVFDFRMVLQVGVLFFLTLSLSVALQWIELRGLTWLLEYSATAGLAEPGRYLILSIITPLLPLVISVFIFAQLFYLVPLPHPTFRAVLVGALVTALLWVFSNYVFTHYALNLTRFDLTTTFGLILAFVLWVYVSGLIFCLGALVVLVLDSMHHGSSEKKALC